MEEKNHAEQFDFFEGADEHTPGQTRAPEGTDNSRDGTAESSLGKRKASERESELEEKEEDEPTSPHAKKERSYYDDMHDSPASLPKHVIVPSANKYEQEKATYSPEDNRRAGIDLSSSKEDHNASILTPESLARGHHHHQEGHFAGAGYQPRHQGPYSDVFRDVPYPSHYTPGYTERNSSGERTHEGDESYPRARRWACDYCNVATFESYDEACAHEEECARHHRDERFRQGQPPRPPAPYGLPPMIHPGYGPGPDRTGLGALYQASQEVVTPPTPHSYHSGRWPPRGPPLPVLPQDQQYYRGGFYDAREDAAYFGGRMDPYAFYPQYGMHEQMPFGSHPNMQGEGKRMLLAMKDDRESLSDRQCYVRSDMVEIFSATEKDVQARHSKGAQKLEVGQVGIRCLFCLHLRPRDRAERAVCYPSSISRIYQTVADMQRFHFEACEHIPRHVLDTYKKLKTTRPRGVGSPQVYWKDSAITLGLVDTESGIRFQSNAAIDEHEPAAELNSAAQKQQQQQQVPSEMSVTAA